MCNEWDGFFLSFSVDYSKFGIYSSQYTPQGGDIKVCFRNDSGQAIPDSMMQVVVTDVLRDVQTGGWGRFNYPTSLIPKHSRDQVQKSANGFTAKLVRNDSSSLTDYSSWCIQSPDFGKLITSSMKYNSVY